MPTLNPLYTDHQSPNLLKYHVVHLTRSSPSPTISLFLHSRSSFARDTNVQMPRYLLTSILGKEKVCFVLQKCTKTILYPNSKKFPGTINAHEPPFKEKGNVVCVLRKCTKTLLRQWRFQNFPVSGTRKVCFRVPKIYWNSPTSINSELKNYLSDNTPDLRFGGRKICFRSPKIH